MDKVQIIIIGAGPAGISAAIQLKRCGFEPVILEKDKIGGLLRNANLVENYPGFPDGISGIELVKLFKKQLENLKIKVCFEKVLETYYKNGIFSVKTDKRTLSSDILVVASGTKPKKLPQIEITKSLENRIFYDVCSVYQISGKKMAIIGSGDAAFDYAINLSKNNGVVILNKGNTIRCLSLLWERAQNINSIDYLENIILENIEEDDDKIILGCKYKDKQEKTNITVDYLIVAIGREPDYDFLSCELKNDPDKINKNLYIIGDVNNGIYRQASISTGNGIRAAMEIYEKSMRKQ